ncbi:MAG TPA: diacylglycerol kinase family protein [Candidatus Acidoferrum sp.]|nr:diacylglycerol kinase family protein [Candidatus Acidoferrum sp.]
MTCCVLLSLVLALPIWLIARLRSRSNPLAWRLDASMPLRQQPPSRPGFTVAARLRSLRHGGRGLLFLARSEHNAWLHLAATAAVIGAGLALRLDSVDWRWIAAAVLWVWSAEALNTAVERICNLVSPEPDERIRIVKDVAAGSVLVSAIGAAAIGAFTFLPYLTRSH